MGGGLAGKKKGLIRERRRMRGEITKLCVYIIFIYIIYINTQIYDTVKNKNK